MVTPQTTVTRAPRVAPARTRVGNSASPCRLIAARGVRSLVKVTPGPRNTSSSTVTPSKIITWFFTVTRLPTTAPVSM